MMPARQTIDGLATADIRTTTKGSGAATGTEPTVVLDSSGQPYQLVVAGTVHPAVVLAAGTGLAEVAANPELVRLVTRVVPGVVVVEQEHVVGFVPRLRLVEVLLLSRGFRGGDEFGSDPLLHGKQEPASGAVRIRCRACGTINKRNFYLPEGEEPCDQGHPLDPDLGA